MMDPWKAPVSILALSGLVYGLILLVVDCYKKKEYFGVVFYGVFILMSCYALGALVYYGIGAALLMAAFILFLWKIGN